MNLFERQGPPPEVIARIKGWIQTHLNLTEVDKILVHEIRCEDPHCPPHGTTIGVIRAEGPSVRFQIAVPAAAIRPLHIRQNLSIKD